MMKVKRVSNISKEEFVKDFLIGNQPVIITDAMDTWDVKKFTPSHLKEEYGDSLVQIYNDLFDMQNVDTLETYFDENFIENKESKEYVRWYSQLLDADLFWSDECFEGLKSSWTHPYFAPTEGLVFPYSETGKPKDITKHQYPYKGIFISGEGARTRLHKDPFESNALLCQFYGTKKIYLFHPSKQDSLMNDEDYVDMVNVNHEKFPDYKNITPDYEDTLQPGEIILFPSGWFHDVTSTSDSISITWNFIHASGMDKLYNHLKNNPEDGQLKVLKYFLADQLPAEPTYEDVMTFYEQNMVNY